MFTFGYNKWTGLFRDSICIALGILLLFYPKAGVSVLTVKLIGVLIVGLAVVELLALVGAMSVVGHGGAAVVLAIIAIIIGVSIVFSNFMMTTMGVLAGVGLLWYGITDIFTCLKVARARRSIEKEKEAEREENERRGSIRITDGLDSAKEVDYTKE